MSRMLQALRKLEATDRLEKPAPPVPVEAASSVESVAETATEAGIETSLTPDGKPAATALSQQENRSTAGENFQLPTPILPQVESCVVEESYEPAFASWSEFSEPYHNDLDTSFALFLEDSDAKRAAAEAPGDDFPLLPNPPADSINPPAIQGEQHEAPKSAIENRVFTTLDRVAESTEDLLADSDAAELQPEVETQTENSASDQVARELTADTSSALPTTTAETIAVSASPTTEALNDPTLTENDSDLAVDDVPSDVADNDLTAQNDERLYNEPTDKAPLDESPDETADPENLQSANKPDSELSNSLVEECRAQEVPVVAEEFSPESDAENIVAEDEPKAANVVADELSISDEIEPATKSRIGVDEEATLTTRVEAHDARLTWEMARSTADDVAELDTDSGDDSYDEPDVSETVSSDEVFTSDTEDREDQAYSSSNTQALNNASWNTASSKIESSDSDESATDELSDELPETDVSSHTPELATSDKLPNAPSDDEQQPSDESGSEYAANDDDGQLSIDASEPAETDESDDTLQESLEPESLPAAEEYAPAEEAYDVEPTSRDEIVDDEIADVLPESKEDTSLAWDSETHQTTTEDEELESTLADSLHHGAAESIEPDVKSEVQTSEPVGENTPAEEALDPGFSWDELFPAGSQSRDESAFNDRHDATDDAGIAADPAEDNLGEVDIDELIDLNSQQQEQQPAEDELPAEAVETEDAVDSTPEDESADTTPAATDEPDQQEAAEHTAADTSEPDDAPAPSLPDFSPAERAALADLKRPELLKQYRTLAQTIRETLSQGQHRSAAFLGVEHQPHVTDAVLRTAMAACLEEEERHVLLVDGSMTDKHLTSSMEASTEFGLAEVLKGRVPWQQAVQATGTPGMCLLPAGRITPPDLKPGDKRLTDLLNELTCQWDMVLIDTGCCEDSAVPGLLSAARNVYLVVRLGETQQDAAMRAIDTIGEFGATLRGSVVTNA